LISGKLHDKSDYLKKNDTKGSGMTGKKSFENRIYNSRFFKNAQLKAEKIAQNPELLNNLICQADEKASEKGTVSLVTLGIPLLLVFVCYGPMHEANTVKFHGRPLLRLSGPWFILSCLFILSRILFSDSVIRTMWR